MPATSAIRAELRATVAIALPLALANLAQMAMGFTNTVMVGRLGTVSLAAAGMGATLYFTAAVAVQGIVTAVAPLAAHAAGSGDKAAAGRIAGAGLRLAILIAVPFMGAIAMVDRALLAVGYDPTLAAEIGRFLRAVLWGAPAFIAGGALRSLLAALGHPRAVTGVLICGIAVNAALCWLLIYGNLGLPALGIVGSGYASAIISWLIFGGYAAYIRFVPSLAALGVFRGVLERGRDEIRQIVRIGLPIAGLMSLESGVFLVSGLLLGLFGAAALGAHQVAINFASITFMVPLGIAQAATVRVAHELGAGRPAVARIAGFLALAIGTGFMLLMALVLWLAPEAIIAVYVDVHDPANRELVAIAIRLYAAAAVFQVVDGAQVIAAGALRGYRDTTVPMLLAGFGYWAIGFLGGWLLAFPLGYGPVGLWWGLGLGLAVVAALLAWRFHRLTGAPEGIEKPT